ncbi:saccharopine dehydrogenase family protein [Nocardioides mesophilus]|uniref:Saccharopine dehydrogenase NADP-binding domain-containing protein n=1 Tax=Nocardioides mesophilus TaxID=433659 RepID=A0A7G9R7F8_9ACTN|nr:saccharopine dehydrogenase NADP-binding domain-containing protein [Nocardioides mesophilus]QNN51533.1 saccharopine dehydrogenase NADP-binding domain-containing protein [Nocardioides mesophilus]
MTPHLEPAATPGAQAGPDTGSGDRAYDLVLLGATGFTGRLTAEYLAEHVPADCRWALAGRNTAKLEEVRAGLARIDERWTHLPLLAADVEDAASLRRLAGSSRVVITTVGPYLTYGEGVVAACAEAGTDYVDLTGEAEFVDRMYLAHHERAVQTGARLVHACGFDSVPHDLGVLFTVQQLPEGVPLRIRGMVRSNATFSGGTFASAMTAFSRVRQMYAAAAERRRREGRPVDRRVRVSAGRPHHDGDTGFWLVPLPTIDPLVVGRSAAALDRYGPDFSYGHYAAVRRLPVALGGIAGAGMLAVTAQLAPLRQQLLKRVPAGQGPDAERRAKSWFTVHFIAEGGGQRVHTEVAGGDPGYTETAKMLAESALCLAFDENPATRGQVTTAVAMGQNLLERLQRAGMVFRVVPDRPS